MECTYWLVWEFKARIVLAVCAMMWGGSLNGWIVNVDPQVTMVLAILQVMVIHDLDDGGGVPHDFGNLQNYYQSLRSTTYYH